MLKSSEKKKYNIINIIVVLFLIFIFIIYQKRDFLIQEDLIFFKLVNSKNQIQTNSKNNKTIKITVNKKAKEEKDLYLNQIINYNNFVNEKIAPGTSGEFTIMITSKEALNYEIKIENENKAPKNFKFYIENEKGVINKNEIKMIKIKWAWEYEISTKENENDTLDGKTIKEYKFQIVTKGY